MSLACWTASWLTSNTTTSHKKSHQSPFLPHKGCSVSHLDPSAAHLAAATWTPSAPVPLKVRNWGYCADFSTWLPGDLILVSALKLRFDPKRHTQSPSTRVRLGTCPMGTRGCIYRIGGAVRSHSQRGGSKRHLPIHGKPLAQNPKKSASDQRSKMGFSRQCAKTARSFLWFCFDHRIVMESQHRRLLGRRDNPVFKADQDMLRALCGCTCQGVRQVQVY